MWASAAWARSAARFGEWSESRRRPTARVSQATGPRCGCRRAGLWRGCGPPAERADSEKRSGPAPTTVPTMLKRITHTFIHVLDQDEALDFYVGKLGMVVNTDADLGFMRWLTVSFPEQPEVQVVLMVPGPPAYDDAT